MFGMKLKKNARLKGKGGMSNWLSKILFALILEICLLILLFVLMII